MILTLPSFAKINWTLEILGKRSDGYHELRTLLQTISVAEELIFEPIASGIELFCDHPGVPCDETNLVYRAARLLADWGRISHGIRITLHKRIPTGAGLGGGSANAAVTLMALQRLWEMTVPTGELYAMAAKLGADVPCFLLGGTCLGVGRGDEVYPLPDIRADFLLLVNAGIQVPTKEVYGNLPGELTNPKPVAKMSTSFVAAYAAETTPNELTPLQNDLEIPVLARHPLLEEIKQRLWAAKARGVLMSGSGSTIFAIFDTEAERTNAQRELSQRDWWCVPVRTLGRAEYHQIYRQAFAAAEAQI